MDIRRTKMLRRVFVLLIALLSAWLFGSCGIQSFEDLADLNPPLALDAYVVNDEIVLKFISYNYEKNFSGFNVFVGADQVAVIGQTRAIANIRTGNAPTFATNLNFERPAEVTLVLPKAYQNEKPLKDMGPMYWIGVAAYDAVYRLNSKCTYPVLIDTR